MLLKHDRLFAEFGKITDIMFVKDSVFLYMQVFYSEYFDHHYNYFVISPTATFVIKLLDNLPYHRALHLKHTFLSGDTKMYISSPFYCG